MQTYPSPVQTNQQTRGRILARRKTSEQQDHAEMAALFNEPKETFGDGGTVQLSPTARGLLTPGLSNCNPTTSVQTPSSSSSSSSSSRGSVARPQPISTSSGRSLNSFNTPTRFCRRVAIEPSDDGLYESPPRVTCCCETTGPQTNQEQQSFQASGQRLDLRGSTLTPTSGESSAIDPFDQPLDPSNELDDMGFESDIQLFCDCGPGCTCVGCMIHHINAAIDETVQG